MLATRFAYLVYFAFIFVLNGLGLLTQWGVVPGFGLTAPMIFAFNMLAAPIAVWGAYRMGELAEEEFRRKPRT